MRRQRLIMFVAVVSVALAEVLSSGLARAADPNFSTVSDILGGQRYLLRDDDLIIDAVNVAPGFQRYVLLTQGLQVASQTPTTVVSTSACPGVMQSRVGRLFNLPNDVIATLAPLSIVGPGCTGSLNLGFYIQDPRNAAHNSQTNITANATTRDLRIAFATR